MRKLTPKQEKFVDNIVSGKNPSEAYKDAYKNNMTPKEISIEAQHLLKNTSVSLAIKEHKKRVQEKLVYTVEDNFKELEVGAKTALEQNNLNAYIKAVELKGKLVGLYTEKKDIEVKSQHVIFVDRRLDE